LYEELLASGIAGEARLLAQSLLAESLAQQGDRTRANALWDEVITGAPSSLIAQDALLRRTAANLGPLDSDQTLAAVRYLEEKRQAFPPPSREQPGLAPAMDLLLGTVYYWRGDYARSREAYRRYVAIGSPQTSTYAQRAAALVKVAQLSERRLGDPATAGRYYRRVVGETPNDVRSFFALEQAARLGAITPDEVRALNLPGVTDDVIAGLFNPGKR
jgi:tetratricopeptide (TPR) repeat protein